MTLVEATITDNSLYVTGDAARDGVSSRVDIRQIGSDVTVEDNDTIGTIIPIVGDEANIQHIDASGVTGAGVYIFSSYSGKSNLMGSQQDDWITSYPYESGDDVLKGRGGDDHLSGNEGDNRLFGGAGDDDMSGEEGDDLLNGGAGNDVVDGGDGIDTMVFRGDLSEYEVSAVDGRYVIDHVGGTGKDGKDSFANIEFLQFADQTVEIEDWGF